MNDYLRSVLLGVIEGLTEFLPVSSTAHLRVVEQLLGLPLNDPFWKMYTIVIQLGAILAVCVYFFRPLREFVTSFPRGQAGDRTIRNHPLSLVLIAFVVTALPALLADKLIAKNLENLYVIGGALIVGGIVMAVVDYLCTRPTIESVERMTLLQSIGIGAAQILSAAFPGTSRSMATIAAGQLAGLTRAAALQFSFYLAIPVMFAATGYSLLKFLKTGGVAINSNQWGLLAVGTGVSFLTALAVIHFFMVWVRRRGFLPFAIYRVFAGAVVLALAARAG